MSKFRTDELKTAFNQNAYYRRAGSCGEGNRPAGNRHRALSLGKGLLFMAVLLLIMTGCSDSLYEEEKEPTEVIITEQAPEEIGVVVVEIKGAVERPGVYTIEADKRLNDLLLLAGGKRPEAELRYINLAKKLKDGDSFYIPAIGEEPVKETGTGTGASGEPGEKEKIDINEATREELMSVPGIGPATADSILKYKASVGAFRTIEDLLEVDRIGDKTLEKLKEYLEVR